MSYIEVASQAELDRALAELAPGAIIVLQGNGRFVFQGSSAPSIMTRDSSAPSIETWGSSAPNIVTRDSSAPRGTVGKHSAAVIRRHAPSVPNIKGAIVLDVPRIETAAQWCDYHGVTVKRGLAILFKAVDNDYSTDNARHAGVFYTPGSKPAAPDWDGGKAECGGGLHFSPHPLMARKFNRQATRYVACPVRVSEIVVHPDATMPQKVKAPRCAGRIIEVDQHGRPLKTGGQA